MKFSTLFKPTLRRFSTNYNSQLNSVIQRLYANDPYLKACFINTANLDNALTRELCAAIGQNSTLELIGLEGANIGDAGTLDLAKSVRLNHNLREFSLFHTGMTGQSGMALASALGESENLTKFTVSNNTFDARTVNAFKTVLCWLGDCRINALGFNNIGQTAAQQLVPTFKTRQNLAHFEYSDNHLDDQGALEVAEMIEVNPDLAYVDLSNNNIGEVGAMAIMTAMQSRTANYSVIMNLRGNPFGKKRFTPQ